MIPITRTAVTTLLTLAQIVAAVLAQSSSEAYTSSSFGLASSTSGSASPSATATDGTQVHIVTVGDLAWQFSPSTIYAKPGDVVQFRFYPTNHSVVRAEYKYPCIPYEKTGPQRTGFFSGFEYVPTVTDEPPLWNLTINDTSPVFFYCSAPGSCIEQRMVGVINPNTTETLDVQVAYAKNSTFMLSPGEPFPPEATGMATLTQVPTSTASSAISTTASASSVAVGTVPSGRHVFSGGAIAGIAVGAAVIVALCGALFFYVGRSGALKEAIDRKDGTVVTTTQVPPEYYMGGGYGHGYGLAQPHDVRDNNTSNSLPAYQHYPPSSEISQSEFGSPEMSRSPPMGGTEFRARAMSPVNETEKAELASPTRALGPHELDGTETGRKG